jgi:hypothetical protein
MFAFVTILRAFVYQLPVHHRFINMEQQLRALMYFEQLYIPYQSI